MADFNNDNQDFVDANVTYEPRPVQQPQQPQTPPSLTDNTIGLVGFILSLVSFVDGFVPFLPLITLIAGFICSFMGMQQEPKTLALVGVILCAIQLGITVITMLACGAFIGAVASYAVM